MEDQIATRRDEAAELATVRKGLGVSPEAVAGALGISTRTLMRYETRKIPPKRIMLKAWRDVLARHRRTA